MVWVQQVNNENWPHCHAHHILGNLYSTNIRKGTILYASQCALLNIYCSCTSPSSLPYCRRVNSTSLIDVMINIMKLARVMLTILLHAQLYSCYTIPLTLPRTKCTSAYNVQLFNLNTAKLLRHERNSISIHVLFMGNERLYSEFDLLTVTAQMAIIRSVVK
jgi:hypothetical protein